MRTLSKSLARTAGVAAGAGLAAVYVRFMREMRVARARQAAGGTIVVTACGPVEYAESGQGPAILISHGSLGGYDQGLLVAELVSGYRVVAPSRFGYLRSPILGDGSPAAQADALAALLDTLGLESAAMLGASAGGPTALHFALRHPDRCWALALVSAICLPPPIFGPEARLVIKLMCASDFAFWHISRWGWGSLLRTWGGAAADWQRALQDPQSTAVLRAMLAANPVSRRNPGLYNDLAHLNAPSAMDPAEIRVPTLIVQGDADPVVPPVNGEFLAGRVPGAACLVIGGGGHLAAVTHKHLIVPVVGEFLRRQAAALSGVE